jgi:hypothetical protein
MKEPLIFGLAATLVDVINCDSDKKFARGIDLPIFSEQIQNELCQKIHNAAFGFLEKQQV